MKTWIPFALFGVLWIDLIRLLSTQWEAREQYGYGWFVPIFAAALLWRRWPDRPGANRENRNQIAGIGKENDPVRGGKPNSKNQEAEMGKNLRPLTSGSSVSCSSSFGRDVRAGVVQSPISYLKSAKFQLTAFALPALCFILCLLLLPLRVILEVNTDWPFIAWPYTLIVVMLTLYAFHLGGPHPLVRSPQSAVRSPWSLGSPWVWHFAFPVAFILVALVWPWRMEKALTQGMMRVVASLTVEVLGWLGIPALQRGNLIELGTGTVGVDEACSGIRSFQSTLMAGLLMGELYRLRLQPRAILVLIGLCMAFFFNVLRTLILSYQANQQGLGAIAKWHDPAGLTIAVACFLSLWLIAVLMTKSWRRGAESKKQKTEVVQQNPSLVAGFTPQPSLAVGSPLSVVSSQLPVASKYLVAAGLWSVLCILATEVWYRSHAASGSKFVRWSVTLPETKPAFERIATPARTQKLLSFDSGIGARWKEMDGSSWSVYFFQWQGKTIQSIMAARYHRPEVCLPASGLQQVSDSQTDVFDTGHLKLPFRKSSYSGSGQEVHVFYCLWQDGDERREGMRSRSRSERLLGPMEGRRRFGQQVLEIITTGYASGAEAEKAVRRQLPELIRVELRIALATNRSAN